MSTPNESQADGTAGSQDPVCSVGAVIARQGFPAAALLAQAADMHRYARVARDWASLHGHAAPSRIVIRDGTVTCYVDSAAAATILRYQANELLRFFGQRCGGTCTKLVIRVRSPARDWNRSARSL